MFHHALRRALLLVSVAIVAGGCATTKKSFAPPEWPLPPDKPRIRFVRSFAGEDDLPQGGWHAFLRVFVPSSPDAVVKQPTGLALSPDDRFLYVACPAIGRVLRVDLEKNGFELVADSGERPTTPFGIAVDGEGNFYVSDTRQHAIYSYTQEGKLRFRVREHLERPTGLAVDRRRKLLYAISGATAESRDHLVQVFDLDGHYLRTIGTRGTGPGQFNFPVNLGVARDGSLFVVDMLNFRIQVFDTEGRLLTMFGAIGAGQPGTFDKAKSVAFDSFDNVYVVDSQQAYVQMFNAKYQPLMAFGGRLDLPGYMLTPTAIAITAKNTIYVADFYAGMVSQYELINTTASDAMAAPEPPPAAPARAVR
jgi:sugar lactone lactonase YvrE